MISLNRYEEIPLKWMFENQPDLLREMMKSPKTLLEHLDKKVQQALTYVETLKAERGMKDSEALEIAANLLLAPADGPASSDDPPKPMPVQEQEAIFNRLSALLDRMEAEQNEEMN